MTTDHPPQPEPVAWMALGVPSLKPVWATINKAEIDRADLNPAHVIPLYRHPPAPGGHAERAIERAPERWQLVPKTFDPDMRYVLNEVMEKHKQGAVQFWQDIWGALLAAAPAHPSTAHSGRPQQPQPNDHVAIVLGAVSPDRQAGDRPSKGEQE